MKQAYPEKFVSENKIFGHIHPGDRIFISSGCGEPQVSDSGPHPVCGSGAQGLLLETEVVHVYSFGIAPYTEDKFKHNFRHTSFFIGTNTRDPINRGAADYSPIFYPRFQTCSSRAGACRRGLDPDVSS